MNKDMKNSPIQPRFKIPGDNSTVLDIRDVGDEWELRIV